MAYVFTTLRNPFEKLLEAEYFLGKTTTARGQEFQFELNAFLSASRSVTFFLQKAFAHVLGFEEWYVGQQEKMKADAAMRFFLELRNISQKQSPICFVGGSIGGGRWSYRFVGNSQPVPEELIDCDIGWCCAQQLSKLASILVECVHTFPFHSCPHKALTEEGMDALNYGWRDIETAIGLPAGYTEVAGISTSDKLRILRREFEPLAVEAIERIAAGDLQLNGMPIQFPDSNGSSLLEHLAKNLNARISGTSTQRDAFLDAIQKRNNKTDLP